jgi:hypothetical protein
MKKIGCWLDVAGNMLEEQGYAPGCIFETNAKLTGDLCEGVVVATNLEPGVPPKSLQDVERVIVKDLRQRIHQGDAWWPLWVTNAHKIDWSTWC